MNKKKLILKVTKVGPKTMELVDAKGTFKLRQQIRLGEQVPSKSYWLCFQVMSKQPKLTFYRQLPDQGF